MPAPREPEPHPSHPATYQELLAEGASVPTQGWDFSWFEGRATEARPSWGYAVSMAERLGRASAVLDLQTGGGEVLDFALARVAHDATVKNTPDADTHPISDADAIAEADATGQGNAGVAALKPPLLTLATEGWPPNVARATALLRPRGVGVVAVADDAPLPFADGAFDLVVSRHPVRPQWDETARVLRPGGTYFAQHVGPGSVFELVEHFLGPQPDDVRSARHPDRERADAEAAGLDVVGLRAERLRMEFHDIGAVVHFLRKVVWMVPGFTVEAYEPQLRELHERMQAEGPFVAHSTRHLFDTRKPG
ncbi:methyltransferase domain-containing protein [Streptomyces tibetensis]|uniref:methyltransferase domain-containing protein n=1 Tax=Streptomyces tibetensis TaxID=2382123 RepID=UPI0033ED85E4